MPPSPHPIDAAATRPSRRVLLLAAPALAVALALGADARASELENLRDENAALRRELDAAREEIRALRESLESTGSPAAAGAGARAAEPPGDPPAAAATSGESVGSSGARTESELVPMRRVSVQVSGSPGADPNRLSSEWMPARDGLRVLESIRLELVRQGDRRLAPRLWLVRTTPGGSLSDVTAATLEIDGKTYTCPRIAYDQERRSRRLPRGVVREREERALFALPAEALAPLARARSASFTAGQTSFPFTDDHVSAAAALAARLERETTREAAR